MSRQLFTTRQADQHCQRRLQRMAKIAQRIARALEGVLGMRQQMVDLRDQRLQLLGHLSIQIGTSTLLQLRDLLTHLFQWAQGSANGVALGNKDQQQRSASQAQTHPLHAAKTLQYRLVILRHADRQILAIAAVVGAVDQQQLALRAIAQLGLHANTIGFEQLTIPQRARTPAAVGKIDAKVMPRELPLERGIETPLIQLQTSRTSDQSGQQALRLVTQILFQISAQATVEDPEAGLRQNQSNQQQRRGQANTEPALNGPQPCSPVKR